ncbi:hypothetical protein EMCG_03221 [[Emmonsia] crescens]|uniref:Reverse transcriptase zinc-binding domain-containing protein n=1 Tax=[Emmonsia] crescens TaxID=73230 RepID=A0A0G2J0J7_9EURO|nr:hypothetical protein EMCG_03221 [Emmonsia crescens UAMH 3008]
MARHQNQGKRPQGVRKRPQEPVRRSLRLSGLYEQIQSKDRKTEQNHPYPFPTSNNSREEACDFPLAILDHEANSKLRLLTACWPLRKHIPLQINPTAPLLARNRERKRSREPEDPLRLPTKRPRTTPATAAVESSAVEVTPDQELLNRVYENDINPIDYWIQRRHWPKKYFRQDNMDSLLARKKSSSLRRKQSKFGSVSTPSDQKPRDEKSAPYRNSRYDPHYLRFETKPKWKSCSIKCKKKVFSSIIQLKLGHGYFKSYLKRISDIENENCEFCDSLEDPEHILMNCSLNQELRAELRQKYKLREMNMKLLFSTEIGNQFLIDFLNETQLATRNQFYFRDENRNE